MSRLAFCRLRFRAPLSIAPALLLAALLLPAAAGLRADFQDRLYHDQAGDHKYTVFVPAGYTPDQKWPVILYLHGASTRGRDGRMQLLDGLAPLVRARAATFPFLVVFPQCEATDARIFEGWLARTDDAQRALKILDQVEKEFRVDRGREILTGMSMGGYGAWSIAAATPLRWSAVVVLSGAANPADADRLKNVPVWSLHGTKDPAVRIDNARLMVDALKAAGGRAYLTELPGAAHYISHVVYGDDAVYAWMLDPASAPKAGNIVRNAARNPTPQELGFDVNPFVPAIEIPESIYVHADNRILEALGYAFPDMLPGRSMSGAMSNRYEVKQSGPFRFDVAMAGLSYRGELERAELTTRDDGWITLNLGLRNLTMEIASTDVNGRLAEATAGPMDIVIGHQRPAWLSVDLRPSVEQRQLRFESGGVRFEIEDDNWYVTQPQVTSRGLPFVRERLAAAVAQNLVEGTYARKHEIEAQIMAAAPRLVQQLEARSAEHFAMPRTIGHQAMPADLPRFKLWPNRLRVDKTGISMVMGMTLGRVGPPSTEQSLKVIERPSVRFEDMPKLPGLVEGYSAAVIEGIARIRIDSGANVIDVRDFNNPDFISLGDRTTLANLIPDLKRYGEDVQVRTLMKLVAPVSMRSDTLMRDSQSTPAEAARADRLAKSIDLSIPHSRMIVEIKSDRENGQWTPYAEFDVRIDQRFRLGIARPTFATRSIAMTSEGGGKVSIDGRFTGLRLPLDRTIKSDEIGQLVCHGWETGALLEMLGQIKAPDVSLGTCRLRLAEVGWCEPFSLKRFVPAATRITNQSESPAEYSVRGPQTAWGGPYTLKPGQSHDFNVSFPLTVRQTILGAENVRTLPMGMQLFVGDYSNTPSPAETARVETSNRRD